MCVFHKSFKNLINAIMKHFNAQSNFYCHLMLSILCSVHKQEVDQWATVSSNDKVTTDFSFSNRGKRYTVAVRLKTSREILTSQADVKCEVNFDRAMSGRAVSPPSIDHTLIPFFFQPNCFPLASAPRTIAPILRSPIVIPPTIFPRRDYFEQMARQKRQRGSGAVGAE